MSPTLGGRRPGCGQMARSSRRGFSLPAVLAVTGMVALVFMVAMTALNSLMSEAASARARVRFLIQALNAEAAVTYMLATEPMAQTGVAVGASRIYDDRILEADGASLVKLDGRAYVWDQDSPIRLEMRDQAGLINLAYLSEAALDRLAERLGVPRSVSRTWLAHYKDYVDQDDLEQVGGGERGSYVGGGPPNRAMRTPDEWLSLPGVRDAVDARAWRRLQPLLAMDATSPNANVNTSDPEVLGILYGVNKDRAEAAVRRREAIPFASFTSFAAEAGAPDNSGEGFYIFPSGRVIFTAKDGRSAWIYRSRLTLTPSGLERPVWIDQTEMTEAPGRAVTDMSNAVRIPYAPR